MILQSLSASTKALALMGGTAVVAAVGVVYVVSQGKAPNVPVAAISLPSENVVPEIAEALRPSIDLVRIEANQQTLVAGKAAPNVEISVLLGEKVIGKTTADGAGGFVFLNQMPDVVVPTELRVVTADGVESDDTVLILPKVAEAIGAEDAAPEPPTLVVAKEDQVELIAPVEQEATVEDFSLSSISYGEDGAVLLSGSGEEGKSVQIYLDNEPVTGGDVETGKWSFEIDGIDEGLYTLRVDQLGSEGQVDARVESPFKRVDTSNLDGVVTVQPGFTLWQLARERLGEGTRYIQIYEANKALIRDPDLIYPGQVFTVPNN